MATHVYNMSLTETKQWRGNGLSLIGGWKPDIDGLLVWCDNVTEVPTRDLIRSIARAQFSHARPARAYASAGVANIGRESEYIRICDAAGRAVETFKA